MVKFIKSKDDMSTVMMMVEVRRIAHASVQIKSENNIIYIDPYYADSFPKEVKSFYEGAEEADLILITHHHHDHCDPSTIEHLIGEKTEIVAPEKCFDRIDDKFITVEPDTSLKFDELGIKAVHAYNQKRKRDSGEPFHIKGEGVGYVIELDEKNIYHPGDTEKIPEMKDIEDIDLMFLPIDGTYTMDVIEAVEMGKMIDPSIAIPFHEKDTDPQKLKERLEQVTDIDVKILDVLEAVPILKELKNR